ncbi:proteasome ATPase [Aestuariimicrobium ganziense]|uniref:proteasome ATPase n=1 Tax=Aestuariimicrobium ganziense TaxID=2773677 RepID=UPI001944E154|nr:proteasome ATPase [Aestuariimicrobium ganziense]
MSSPEQQRTDQLERRLADARADARQLAQTNEKLNQTLKQARAHLVSLKAQLDALGQPPLGRGRVVALHDQIVDVATQGRLLRVAVTPEWGDIAGLEVGDVVLLNESQVIVGVLNPGEPSGADDLATVVEVDATHAVVTTGTDEVRLRLGPGVLAEPPSAGESVAIDRTAGLVLTTVARQHVQELVLDEVPDVAYTDIGGLDEQIERIRDAVELPFLHPDLYRSYQLKPPKGVLLYGPPGCGKTMIAKAVAKSLADQLTDSGAGSSFITVKGPELLNKFVGETERQIRLVFERAREQATAGIPVVVFFDEMDSLFRTRGSGVSSDVESTIVPQLLSEIDGVEGLDNVIIIGASNREDMIDPAILRPGRLDVKIKLDRPSRRGAVDILGKYLTVDVPLDAADLAAHGGDRAATVTALVEATVASIYDQVPANEFLRVTYASGDTEVLHFADFASGAMLRNVVDRAKKYAIKDELAGRGGGVSRTGLVAACREEFVENEDLPNTTNPDDWARISGRKGERIVFVQSLVSQHAHRLDDEAR